MSASILNDVLGPVMRGPSSSHTAGAYRIAVLLRALFGEPPDRVEVAFDPGGSYAPTYRILGVDSAFAAGLMGWDLIDRRYPQALAGYVLCARHGYNVRLRAGIKRNEDGEFAAHAWLEHEGSVVLGDLPDLTEFVPFDGVEDLVQ